MGCIINSTSHELLLLMKYIIKFPRYEVSLIYYMSIWHLVWYKYGGSKQEQTLIIIQWLFIWWYWWSHILYYSNVTVLFSGMFVGDTLYSGYFVYDYRIRMLPDLVYTDYTDWHIYLRILPYCYLLKKLCLLFPNLLCMNKHKQTLSVNLTLIIKMIKKL